MSPVYLADMNTKLNVAQETSHIVTLAMHGTVVDLSDNNLSIRVNTLDSKDRYVAGGPNCPQYDLYDSSSSSLTPKPV